jgi:hypothetical protein
MARLSKGCLESTGSGQFALASETVTFRVFSAISEKTLKDAVSPHPKMKALV